MTGVLNSLPRNSANIPFTPSAEPENVISFFWEKDCFVDSPSTSIGSLMNLNTWGRRLMEQEIRLRLKTYSRVMNHQEWYMSKKPSFPYICSFMALMVATYSGGSGP